MHVLCLVVLIKSWFYRFLLRFCHVCLWLCL